MALTHYKDFFSHRKIFYTHPEWKSGIRKLEQSVNGKRYRYVPKGKIVQHHIARRPAEGLKNEGYNVGKLPANPQELAKMIQAQGAVFGTYAEGAYTCCS